MKPPANPVTVEDAAKFAGYIATWQAKLNLLDWRVIPGGKVTKGNCADISISVPDHCAVGLPGALVVQVVLVLAYCSLNKWVGVELASHDSFLQLRMHDLGMLI